LDYYCISGLGGDHRAFQYLQLEGVELKPLKCLKPEPSETIESYAARLAEGIDTTQEFGLIGLSFGGMLSVEISKIVKPKKLILISSILTKNELPLLYRLGGKTGLHRLLMPSMMKVVHPVLNGLRNSRRPEKRNIIAQMLRESDNDFLEWALATAANWQNETMVEAYRIHGTTDWILPIRTDGINFKIQGGHLVIMTQARKISEHLNSERILLE